MSVPRGRGERLAFHTLFLIVTSNGVPQDTQREQAKRLIEQRIQSAGVDAPIHLGDVTL